MRITPALLQAAVGCPAEQAELWAHHIDEACEHYAISTPVRLAAFLAQVGHESRSLEIVVESLNYSIHALLVTFGRHRISEADAKQSGRAAGRRADQVAIGNAVYGGEWGAENLGNTQPNDGFRFKGRGLIQITGRHNYARVRDRMRQLLQDVPDFEAKPEALERPRWAALSAADYWDDKGLNALADRGSFAAITKRINGGLNGQDDRLARWSRAKVALGFSSDPGVHLGPEAMGEHAWPTQKR